MRNLYIDFDGVILDTITPLYTALELEGIDKNDLDGAKKFYSEYDWSILLKESKELNNSISNIKKLMECGKYNVSILTHVNSLNEAIQKIRFINTKIEDITIIIVPKEMPKINVVHEKDSILVDDYSGNLELWRKNGGIAIRFNLELEDKGFLVINDLSALLNMEFDN